MHRIVVLIVHLCIFARTTSYSLVDERQDDPGQPLFLTPYLEEGKIDEARQLSIVELPPFTGSSFSGYLTVNKTYSSNMFFWFFPAQTEHTSNTPVILWLNGGPGTSSLLGLFVELGPIFIDANGNIQPRPITWNKNYHLLFVDNPVGAGFSFTLDKRGFALTEDDVAHNLYECLTQFFRIYTEYASNPFYVSGESYAGKYVPSITYKIHVENLNPSVKVRINLKGMTIGDGICDPINQYDYGNFLYQVGFIDENEKAYVDSQVIIMRYNVQKGRYIDAYLLFDALMDGTISNTTSFFYNATGIKYYNNYLHTLEPIDQTYFIPFLNQTNRRKQIHVGNTSFGGQSGIVAYLLLNDVMQSMADKIAAIANASYGILIYNGQLDAIIPASTTMNWLDQLNWIGTNELRKAERLVWKVAPSDSEVAGYIKKANKDRFFFAIIRNSGHLVPHDQPRAMLDLLDRFITSQK